MPENNEQILLALFLLFISLIVLVEPGVAAMSMIGTTGLVDIPTARIISDGRIAFGVGYTDRKYSLRGPEYAQVAYYVTVGCLPFLEGTLRVTNFPGTAQAGSYGSEKDRMACVRLQVINEARYLPSILLGIHDVLGIYGKNPSDNVYFNTAYVVASRSIRLPLIGALDVHLGYASDVMLKEARNHSMLGPFAGLEKNVARYLTIIGEYDTHKYNVGLRIMPRGDRANIDLVALGLKRISGGMSISFDL